MLKLKLRSKLIIYSIALAIIPLGIAGKTMIQITQDELKSSVNDQISNTIAEISNDIDELYANTWLAPLMLITRGIESETLGVDEKLSLIKAGIENIKPSGPSSITCPIAFIVLGNEGGLTTVPIVIVQSLVIEPGGTSIIIPVMGLVVAVTSMI